MTAGCRRPAIVLAAVLAVAVVMGLGVGAVGTGSVRLPGVDAATPPWWGCGVIVREPLDPRSLHRVLPGHPEPSYGSPAPTSGPHAEAATRGWLTEPLPRPLQLGVLEEGRMLIQYRPDLAAAQQDRIRRLVEGPTGLRGAAAAPNPAIGDPVVVTSWRSRMRCRTVDGDAIADFAARVVPASVALSP